MLLSLTTTMTTSTATTTWKYLDLWRTERPSRPAPPAIDRSVLGHAHGELPACGPQQKGSFGRPRRQWRHTAKAASLTTKAVEAHSKDSVFDHEGSGGTRQSYRPRRQWQHTAKGSVFDHSGGIVSLATEAASAQGALAVPFQHNRQRGRRA